MKTLKIFLLSLMTSIGVLVNGNAQNPVKYQAVLRDVQGYVRPDETVSLDLTLTDNGKTVYAERHTTRTDALGQIQVFLGQGTPAIGFTRNQTIDWSRPLQLQVSENGKELTSMPVTAVPKALHALESSSASTLSGKTFSDEAEPAPDNYYSSAKVQRLIQGQTGQTGLAKEIAERQAEDLRILDSIRMEAERRLTNDLAILDSIRALAGNVNYAQTAFLDSIAAERKARIDADLNLLQKIEQAVTRVEEEALARSTEDLRIWDSIDRIADIASEEQNFCEASDPERGIYTSPIPLYSTDKPDEIGLFTMPELKILKQSGSCDLFSALELAGQLDRSYKTRVLTYNTTENIASPQTVTIPAGSNGVEVYVDNYMIDTPSEYLTYDVLVFDVEYYHIAPGKGKLYVTLVRE